MLAFRDRFHSGDSTRKSTGRSCEPTPDVQKHYLDVPFEEKNEAKQHGARWDPECKKWYTTSTEGVLHDRWGIEARALVELVGEDREFGGNELGIELVPKSCWCRNVLYGIQKCDRQRVQDLVMGRTNRTCETCGVQNARNTFHVHGRWTFDESTHTQELTRLMCMCENCYNSTHYGASHYQGKQEAAFLHLTRTLNLSDNDAKARVDAAYALQQERNQSPWDVSMSLLETNRIRCETAERSKSRFANRQVPQPEDRVRRSNAVPEVVHRSNRNPFRSKKPTATPEPTPMFRTPV